MRMRPGMVVVALAAQALLLAGERPTWAQRGPTKVPPSFRIVWSEDITQRKRSHYIVRTGWTSAQPMHPFGTWVYENLKYRKIAMIGYDFAFGWEVAAGFHRTFEDAGGQIVQKLWPPLNTPDFAPYIAQLRRDVDA